MSMNSEEDELVDSTEAKVEFELQTEELLRRLQEMDEEEFERRKEKLNGDRRELFEEHDISKEDMADFFGSILSYSEEKRRIREELPDITEFDDDEWEDGFAFFDRVSGELEASPTCLECRETLEPERDEIRVAADGAVVYTNCSNCGEASLEDTRDSIRLFEEWMPEIPDPESVTVEMDDEVKEMLDSK